MQAWTGSAGLVDIVAATLVRFVADIVVTDRVREEQRVRRRVA
jgi:hypothetical protein